MNVREKEGNKLININLLKGYYYTFSALLKHYNTHKKQKQKYFYLKNSIRNQKDIMQYLLLKKLNFFKFTINPCPYLILLECIS